VLICRDRSKALNVVTKPSTGRSETASWRDRQAHHDNECLLNIQRVRLSTFDPARIWKARRSPDPNGERRGRP
jgi:hypothetical protein